eukprot:TRINITY_DN9417_c0_g1_i18.p1 TRINITY_DN9417_c0_g1~~TRINITY_DN9417_c0_g1_i18.p1  ORF type:complete len:476 (+),score=98.28 TRINITY_DN9417_c0_g1_i18:542-1969(+)
MPVADCAVCNVAAGYRSTGSYKCGHCNGAGAAASAMGLVLACLGAAAAVAYVLPGRGAGGHRHAIPSWPSMQRLATRACNVHFKFNSNSLRIPIVVVQLIAGLVSITGLQLAPSFEAFIHLLAVLPDLSFTFGCIFDASFYQRLLFMTLAPLVPVIFLGCSWLWSQRRMKQILETAGSASALAVHAEVLQRHWTLFLAWTFFIYGTVSSTVFQTFACDEIEEWSSRPYNWYLRADYSITCYDRHYWFYFAYAAVMVLVYPIGIPALYAYVLRRKGRADQRQHCDIPDAAADTGNTSESNFLMASSFLWDQYTDDANWWELVECARRVLFTGFLVFVMPGTAGQAAVSMLLAFVAAVSFLAVQPYRQRTMHYQYFLGVVIVFLSSVNALLLKVEVSSDDGQSQVVIGALLIALSVVLVCAAVASSFYGASSYSSTDSGIALQTVLDEDQDPRQTWSAIAASHTLRVRAPLDKGVET